MYKKKDIKKTLSFQCSLGTKRTFQTEPQYDLKYENCIIISVVLSHIFEGLVFKNYISALAMLCKRPDHLNYISLIL